MRLVFRTMTALDPSELVPDEIHVWLAPLDSLPEDASLLVEMERSRADGYRHPKPRQQFIRARGMLRTILANYLRCLPMEVSLAIEPTGKPVVAGGGLHFNVSHTAGWAVVAVAAGPVGVDLEALRPMPNAAGLVERYFHETERSQFERLPANLCEAAFFRGWTCKEAVLKGIGCGARGLDQCVVELDPREPPRVIAPNGWDIACWEPAIGVVGAVAWRTE